MAGWGWPMAFNMVIMSFFAAIDLGTTVVVAFSLRQAQSAAGKGGRAPVAGHYERCFPFCWRGDPCLWPGDY